MGFSPYKSFCYIKRVSSAYRHY
ncbi:hypothetical protein AERO8C_160243 [Aeromonas veronii]|uniref:Uncharacterized protein n=1 Tax=Aeromonas veronii TaxID=654 RepID=A0A653KXZ3_AERVE|nr:hypothetical protein AERO8C_160243 [Aeromonas veronii]